MNGSNHRERTASGQQDRSSSVAHSIEVPSEIIRKWQEIVNLLAEIMHVPSASIMRVDPPHIKVFVSSTSKGNPCEPRCAQSDHRPPSTRHSGDVFLSASFDQGDMPFAR